MPLPPVAPKAWAPRGGRAAVTGATTTPAPTATWAVAALPSESTTRTWSVTPPVAPAV